MLPMTQQRSLGYYPKLKKNKEVTIKINDALLTGLLWVFGRSSF
jgi:hypothetical protein